MSAHLLFMCSHFNPDVTCDDNCIKTCKFQASVITNDEDINKLI